eukprot:363162-Chlamydomonas_euryale.AAC.3
MPACIHEGKLVTCNLAVIHLAHIVFVALPPRLLLLLVSKSKCLTAGVELVRFAEIGKCVHASKPCTPGQPLLVTSANACWAASSQFTVWLSSSLRTVMKHSTGIVEMCMRKQAVLTASGCNTTSKPVGLS